MDLAPRSPLLTDTQYSLKKYLYVVQKRDLYV